MEENKGKNRGYSCRKKVADLVAQELSRVPGPGKYDSHLKNKNTAPRCSTTQTKRKTFMDDTEAFKKSYPGPGNHDPAFSGTKYRASSSNLFSKSPRKPLDENEKTPGPVEYVNDKINILNAAPKFSSTKTVAKNEFLGVNPETTAPGQYDPSITQTKPRCSVSEVPKEKRPDFEKHRQSPGPGFYNLRGKEEGPTWKYLLFYLDSRVSEEKPLLTKETRLKMELTMNFSQKWWTLHLICMFNRKFSTLLRRLG